jgi:hypothetical protein
MADLFEGMGGSYVLDKDGNRVKVEGTIDKLDAPAVSETVDLPVAEPVAPKAINSKEV